jgi:hypothetical protein
MFHPVHLLIFGCLAFTVLAELPREWLVPPGGTTHPPAELKSPLVFADGEAVKSPSDWAKRRAEILAYWHEVMGPWPELLAQPDLAVLELTQR